LWIKQHKIKAFYTPLYIASEEDFAKMLPQLPKLGFCGVNITVPYKELAFKICTDIIEEARYIKAVNCIKFVNFTVFNTFC
jgi:shikimate dehydrogenase